MTGEVDRLSTFLMETFGEAVHSQESAVEDAIGHIRQMRKALGFRVGAPPSPAPTPDLPAVGEAKGWRLAPIATCPETEPWDQSVAHFGNHPNPDERKTMCANLHCETLHPILPPTTETNDG